VRVTTLAAPNLPPLLPGTRCHPAASVTTCPPTAASLRILAITTLYPGPTNETAATFNRCQLGALSREHEVRVIAPVLWTERWTSWKALTAPRCVQRTADRIRVSYPTYYYPPRALTHCYGQFYLASVRGTANRVIRQFRPDVVFACWAHPDGWAAVRIARQAGLPILIKVHGSDVLLITKGPRRRARIAEALGAADGVIAVSQDLANHVIRLGVEAGKVHVIPHGVDDGLFRPGDRAEARARLGLPAVGKVLLFVGNVLLSKGAGVLVEACARLRDRALPCHCYLVGEGRDAARVRALVGRHGLEGRMTLAGHFPPELLPDWYRAADVVVLPSYSEGIPNVLREAMMCGRPFVATRVGGIPEITPAGVGRLVEPGDPAALAAALADTLEQPPRVDLDVVRRLNISWEESARLLAARLRAIIPA
jgi:teichuronic acid biosynthesis glycosyltransferase TuaC